MSLSNMSLPNVSLPLVIVPMEERDLPAIMAIEEQSFPTPWSVNTYRYEMSQNELSRYYVVRPRAADETDEAAVLAYAGFWNMGDSAHVTTIATHPRWRRRHLAVWLMLHMMEEAAALGIDAVTLEVRAGNVAAQGLYRRLGFVEVGVRRRYYPPTKTHPAEDAILMTRTGLDTAVSMNSLRAQKAAVEARIATAIDGDEPASMP
jgi:ribosomal-protein-alanine N-acetyltransferase